MHPYYIMAIVAGVAFIVFQSRATRQTAVGGGAGIGTVVGLILALVKHNWHLLALCFAIGVFVGLFAELLGYISDRLRRRQGR
jgi:uncharacterized membrane protein